MLESPISAMPIWDSLVLGKVHIMREFLGALVILATLYGTILLRFS